MIKTNICYCCDHCAESVEDQVVHGAIVENNTIFYLHEKCLENLITGVKDTIKKGIKNLINDGWVKDISIYIESNYRKIEIGRLKKLYEIHPNNIDYYFSLTSNENSYLVKYSLEDGLNKDIDIILKSITNEIFEHASFGALNNELQKKIKYRNSLKETSACSASTVTDPRTITTTYN